MSGLEIRDQTGKLVLTSQDTFLTYPNVTPKIANMSKYVRYSDAWIANIKNKTGRSKANYSTPDNSINVPKGSMLLIQPLDGCAVSYIPENATYIFSSNAKVNTDVAKYLFMSLTAVSSNFSSGILDCYDTAGKLTWSLSSLAKSIQLVYAGTKNAVAGETYFGQQPFKFTTPVGYEPEDMYFMPMSFYNEGYSVDVPDTQNIVTWVEMIVQRDGRDFYIMPVSYASSVYGNICSIDNNNSNKTIATNGTTFDPMLFGFNVFVFWLPPQT